MSPLLYALAGLIAVHALGGTTALRSRLRSSSTSSLSDPEAIELLERLHARLERDQAERDRKAAAQARLAKVTAALSEPIAPKE